MTGVDEFERIKIPRWIEKMLRDSVLESERTQQRHLGPSEIGSPCQRKLALKVVDSEWLQLNGREVFGFRPFIGTAVHETLAGLVQGMEHPPGGIERLLSEVEVEVTPEVSGTLDLGVIYGDGTAEIWDWKIVGPGTLKKSASIRVAETYAVQADLYALGLQHTFGHEVTSVGVMFLPAAGELDEAVPLRRPFSEERAEGHLRRFETIRRSVAKRVTKFESDHIRAAPVVDIASIVNATKTADDWCESCPWLGHKVGGVLLCAGAERREEDD